MLMTMQLSNYKLLDIFLERCNYWHIENIDLFEKMYQHYIENGCFINIELNAANIVDNDITNNCDVVYKNNCEKDFKKLLKLYKEGNYDVSCEIFETIDPSYIEAVSDDDTRILIRYE